MSRNAFLPGCTAALLFCFTQLQAQQPSTIQLPIRNAIFTPSFSHTGLLSYPEARKWHGLNLAQFFGTGNTATGVNALASCTSCSSNVADGYSALSNCSTCANNTAVGENAMYNNFTGGNNTAVGAMAAGGVLGSNNTAVGAGSFENGDYEANSTAVGYLAMNQSQAPNGYNTAVGAYALYGNRNTLFTQGPFNQGSYNVASGAYALYNDSTGNGNTVTGYEGLYKNTSGGYNYAGGFTALYNNTTGYLNSAEGVEAMYSNTTGYGNTSLGAFALESNTTGTYNTSVGYNAMTGSGALTNATALGANATVNSSNQVVIGNTSVTSIGGYAGWSNFSDGRYKKNIRSNVPGLAFINKLNPITYNLDIAGIESKLHKGRPTTALASSHNNPQDDPAAQQGMQDKSAIVYTGFVAQDVEKAADSLGFAFSGVDKPKNPDQNFYALRYSDFVPPLVKAVQELSANNDKKDSVINALQSKFDSLQTQVNELRAMLLAQKASVSGASLDQNSPNPFTGSTIIGYNLPKGVSSAQMQITDIRGNVLALIPLSGSGKSTITANVSGYAAGTYMYSLIVDGKLVGTRKMISVR